MPDRTLVASPAPVAPAPVAARRATPADDRLRAAPGSSPARIALRRLRRSRVAIVSGSVVACFVAVAVLAPVICHVLGVSPMEDHSELVDFDGSPLVGISWHHPFGVAPSTGRDLFARWIYGARYSLLIATIAATLATVIGVLAGLVAGYLGGWVDRILSFLIDLFLTVPFLLVAAVVGALVAGTAGTHGSDAYAHAQLVSLIVLLFTFGWMGLARLVRAQVLSLREQQFVLAARTVGCSTPHILFRQLLPHLLVPIVLGLSIGLPAVISAEAGLSLLGVGIVDLPSWGATIRDAQSWWRADPAYLWQPVAGIAVLVLALNLLGDAVRDAFDPKSAR